MPIVYGAPSRFIDLGRDQQQLQMQLAELQSREAMAAAAQRNAAIGQVADAGQRGLFTAIGEDIRTREADQDADLRDRSYRRRLAYDSGFETPEAETAAANERGMTIPELRTWRDQGAEEIRYENESRRALDTQRRQFDQRLPQLIREEALKQATAPLIVPPDLQQFVQQLPTPMKKDLAEIQAADQSFLMDLYNEDPDLHPEEVVEGRRRIQAKFAPILQTLKTMQTTQVPVEKQIEQKTWTRPDGVTFALNQHGVPKAVHEPVVQKSPTGLDAHMERAYSDWISAGNAPQAWATPGGGEEFARQQWVKQHSVIDPKSGEVVGMMEPDGRISWKKQSADPLDIKMFELATKIATTPLKSRKFNGNDIEETETLPDPGDAVRRARIIHEALTAPSSGETPIDRPQAAPPAATDPPQSRATRSVSKAEAYRRVALLEGISRQRGGLTPAQIDSLKEARAVIDQ